MCLFCLIYLYVFVFYIFILAQLNWDWSITFRFRIFAYLSMCMSSYPNYSSKNMLNMNLFALKLGPLNTSFFLLLF